MFKIKNRLFLKAALVFVLYLFLPFSIFAEENDDEDIIVVSSSKIEQSEGDSLEKVNVITEHELENKGAKTVAEALRTIPGLTVTNSALKNKSTSVMIQGFEGQYVKILIDGVSVSTENAGAAYLERIPIENIDHIEIIQGASSALYGSDALGGVINIITKKTASEDGKAKFCAHVSDDFATSIQNKAAAGISFSTGKFSAAANGSFDCRKGSFENVSEPVIGNIEKTKTPKTHLGYADARLGWNSDTWRISLDGMFSDYMRETTTIGTSRNSKYISNSKYTEQRVSATLRGEKDFSDLLYLKAFGNYKYYAANLDETKVYSTTADSDSNALVHEIEGEVQLFWDLNAYNTLVCGLNARSETGSGSSFEGIKNQILLSFYAQDSIDFTGGDKIIVLCAGGRVDFQPGFDDTKTLWQATPKLSVKYSPFESTSLRLSYGMGYKMPALNQKYFVKYHSHGNTGFYIYGNKNLDPEISHGVNLNFEQKIFESIKLFAGGFYNFHINMIDSQKINGSTSYQYQNVGKAFTTGFVCGLSGKVERFDFYLNYSYTVAKKIEEAAFVDLSYRVPHRVTCGLSYMIPVIETQIGFDAEWNSPQVISDDGIEKSPDLFLLNFTIRKKFFKDRFELYVRGENILNNIHFIKGSGEKSQRDFFSLYDGPVFHFGTRFKY